MFNITKYCRLCGFRSQPASVCLGEQALSGVFPKQLTDEVPRHPLAVFHCSNCALVQLTGTAEMSVMYGSGYGYRSSATSVMRKHLEQIATEGQIHISGKEDPLIVDIGCNDGYLLQCFDYKKKIGFDPLGVDLKDKANLGFQYVSDFFSETTYIATTDQKADLITSISMFYDIEDPIKFAQSVYQILSDEGIWIVEFSYLLDVVEQLIYDSICHEHLLYLSLTSMMSILNKANLKIIDLSRNDLNGGSLRLVVAKNSNMNAADKADLTLRKIDELLRAEEDLGIHDGTWAHDFNARLLDHKEKVTKFFNSLSKPIIAYGASTKGNVILQYCGLDSSNISAVLDISPHKVGHYLPGTKIPILDMSKFDEIETDYYFVLPWAFREYIVANEKNRIKNNINTNNHTRKFIFPLPDFELVEIS